jgi:peptidylprolyl isomerase
MRVLSLLSPLLLVACSSTSATPAGSIADAAIDSGEWSDSSPVDAADAAPVAYCPAGYNLVPFATESAITHTFSKADAVLDPAKDYLEVIETDQGRIVWHFRTHDAPIASNSFVFLTLHHYFDGVLFHRVIEAFMAQGGDPNTLKANKKAWGTGGPGYSFDVEPNPAVNFDAPGIVAMANAGAPNTTGSQFFITFVPYPSLNQNYTIVGNVTEGLDVLPKIARGEPPAAPTRIVSANVCAK